MLTSVNIIRDIFGLSKFQDANKNLKKLTALFLSCSMAFTIKCQHTLARARSIKSTANFLIN